LNADDTGYENTGVGVGTLSQTTTGDNNTAIGAVALLSNTRGSFNTAAGQFALNNNTTGENNNAFGSAALLHNTTGSHNIGVGDNAGSSLTTGSYNIDIGNEGVAGEGDTIRIGSSNQKATYIAGIYGTSVSGNAVVVNSSGQLGVVVSSERFKTDIQSMGSASDKLQQLRPVTFHLKTDPQGNLQYGLIAEEVAKVYPDLVIRDESGRIDGVRYDELTPLLLNQLQQQQLQLTAQAAQLQQMQQQLSDLRDVEQVLLRQAGSLPQLQAAAFVAER